jgi:hypothetical protein
MFERKTPTFYIMTRAGVHNNEFYNLALEERFYRIQTADLNEFCQLVFGTYLFNFFSICSKLKI